jgi:2-polyprenyl-3-methyl-5-hydroxy-6-metoxy-1,4-benzoquinol methylase
MNVIVVLNSFNGELKKYIEESKFDKYSIIDLNGKLFQSNFQNNEKIINISLDENEKDEIDKLSNEVSKNWLGDNKIYYKKLCLEKYLEYSSFEKLISLNKTYYLFQKLASSFTIDSVVLINDSSEEYFLVKKMCLDSEIEIDNIVFSQKTDKIKFNPKIFLKKIISFFIILRHNFYKLLKTFSPGFTTHKGISGVYFNPYSKYEKFIIDVFGNSVDKVFLPKNYINYPSLINRFNKSINSKIIVSQKFKKQNDQKNIITEIEEKINNVEKINLKLPTLVFNSFKDFVKSQLHYSIDFIDEAILLIEKYKFKYTFLPFDHVGLERALVMLSPLYNIQTILFQHGVVNNYKFFPIPISNKLFVFDKTSFNAFIKIGYNKNNISFFPEKIFKNIQVDQLNDFNLNFEQQNISVLFAAQPFVGLSAHDDEKEHSDIYNDIILLAKNFPNYRFYIKLHPWDAGSVIEQNLTELINKNPNIFLSDELSIIKLIMNCHIVISETSTTLLEAVNLNRTCISYNKRNHVKMINPYYKNERVEVIEDYNSLKNILDKYSSLKNINNVKANYLNENYDIYYDDRRWDILSVIPNESKQILDVGCGSGWVGRKIKSIKSCKVHGIEMFEESALKAKKFYDKVYQVNLDVEFPDLGNNKYDCIICSDILEHLNNPVETLNRLKAFLNPNGEIIISLPNISHYTIILSLLKNKFKYTDEGILDKTHKVFFTEKSIIELMDQLNLKIIKKTKSINGGRIIKIFNILSLRKMEYLLVFQNIFLVKKNNE